jgi:hypothetical protein
MAFVSVLTVTACSVLVTVLVDFRDGGYLLATALGMAAVLRTTLPPKYCLGLLIRNRHTDVITMAALAVAVAISVSVVPG